MAMYWQALQIYVILPTTCICFKAKVLLTIDNSGHPPESQQDEESYPIKGVLVEDENNVQHKGNYHHQTIEHLKPVLEKLQVVSKQLTSQLHQEECQKSQAQVVKHLPKKKYVSVNQHCINVWIKAVSLFGVSGQICVSPLEQGGHVPAW